ncbi:MAG TPA: FHA domain-containing protein [Acidimicrobiales bacterium]|jgi:pSer/pThr/pTyr-binding forkhead associated (FHA) protein|nr:FHA domain-containing protein [Acidimicrobiales bacterium]
MSEQLLNILKLCLLALLYLFFLRVLRAVWTEVKGPVVAAPKAPGRERRRPRRERGTPHLRIVEPAEQRGRTFPLSDELTVGRAAGCRITLDDTFASQIHARVFIRDGQCLVEDLGSTNGTYLNRQKVRGPMVIARGDLLQIGNTIMELS